MNVDGAIVRTNVQRAAEGKALDVPYLASLSLDAVPALAEAFQNPALKTGVHEGIGAALFCQMNSSGLARQNGDFRSANFSTLQAESVLNGLNGGLASYKMDGDRTLSVVTPGGDFYECTSSAESSRD